MKKMSDSLWVTATAVGAAAMLAGCATAQKRMEPVGEKQVSALQQQQSEFLRGLESVKEQPELEPEWADSVKEIYPNWRRHYWVDRGQWGNRGYILGHAPVNVEPPVAVQVTPMPPAPPTIVPSEPPQVELPAKPTTYIVKKGDSLWRIAGKVYGNPLKWPRIYRANQPKIKNPNRIFPNQALVIPQN